MLFIKKVKILGSICYIQLQKKEYSITVRNTDTFARLLLNKYIIAPLEHINNMGKPHFTAIRPQMLEINRTKLV